MSFPSPGLSLLALAVQDDPMPDSDQPRQLRDGIHLRWSFEASRGFPAYGYHLLRRESPLEDVGFDRWKAVETVTPTTVLRTKLGEFSSGHGLRYASVAPVSRTGLDLRGVEGIRFELSRGEAAFGVRLEIQSLFAGTSVEVRSYLRERMVEVVRQSISTPGTILLDLQAGPCTSIVIPAAEAILLRLDATLGSSRATQKSWDLVPGFPYPLCLPLAHASYSCLGRPTDLAAAEQMAQGRLHYPVNGLVFPELHQALARLFDRPPTMSMREVLRDLPFAIAAKDGPVSTDFRLLDSVLLAGLHPAVAQVLGLYWLDAAVDQEKSYDYLLLADHGTRTVAGPQPVIGEGGQATQWVASHLDALSGYTSETDPYPSIDREVLFRKRMVNDPALESPSGVTVRSLPVTGRRQADGRLPDVAGSVGVIWNRPDTAAASSRPATVLHHVRRRTENGEAGSWTFLTRDKTLDKPVALPKPPRSSTEQPVPNSDVCFFDPDLADGTYRYRVTGVDLFGRWSGPTDSPALDVLDETGPPPTALEAWVVDPDDPWLTPQQIPWPPNGLEGQDWRGLIDRWRQDDPDVVGLCARWHWSIDQQSLAPDAAEFRLYWLPGQWNVRLGATTRVEDPGDRFLVSTDVEDRLAADAWRGARLWVAGSAFEIVSSFGESSLRVVVGKLGTAPELSPAEGKSCSLIVPAAHALHVDPARARHWSRRLSVVGVVEHHHVDFTISRDPDGEELQGTGASLAGGRVTLPIDRERLSALTPWLDHVHLEGLVASPIEGFPIRDVDGPGASVALGVVPATGGGDLHWKIGRPSRAYQVFIPAPRELSATTARPLARGQVGVSAADDKARRDDPRWDGTPLGGRPGNEGDVSAPVQVIRVLRQRPQAPEPWEGPDRLYATAPDYHARSCSTVRWRAKPTTEALRVHVARALDRALFAIDRAQRPRGSLATLVAAGAERLPAGWQNVAPELDGFDAAGRYEVDAYRALSDRALRVIASLRGNEKAFTQLTKVPIAQESDRRGPDDPIDYAVDSGVRAWVDESLPGRGRNAYFYRVSFVDGVQNRGDAGPAGPPVYLLGNPPAPVVTEASGSRDGIALTWQVAISGHETGSVRIYRTTDHGRAVAPRQMDLVATIPATEVRWLDVDAPRRRLVFYRLALVEGGDRSPVRESEPSLILAARAPEGALPDPPRLLRANWGRRGGDGSVILWTAGDAEPPPSLIELHWDADRSTEVLVQRRHPGRRGIWETLSPFLAASSSPFVDERATPFTAYEYRLHARSAAGTMIAASDVLAVATLGTE